MKSITKVLTVIFLTCMVQVGMAQISGSAHDFSNKIWNPSHETCVVCHTPHNAVTGIDAPLWNHELTQATFTVYSSPTFDGSGTIGQPNGNSKLCLSCHDGTVAADNFGGASNNTSYVRGSALLGTDLSNDHPISFTYDATLATADGGLYDPGTQTSGLGGTIASDLLFNNKLQCASCHDVHNGSGLDYLLVISNVGSALCLTCHDK